MGIAEVLTPEERLLSSAKEGNLRGVIRALTEGASTESRDAEGKTALILAVIKGCQEIVSYLIRTAGANINAADNNGQTPLHHAVICNNLDMVNLLLSF